MIPVAVSADREPARGDGHEEAARLAGLSRSAAYEWHNRYEEDGIEGLRDRPRPGRQPRVDAGTSARFKERIVAGAELQRDGVVAFRGVDAQRILKEEFAIDCSLSTVNVRLPPISQLTMSLSVGIRKGTSCSDPEIFFKCEIPHTSRPIPELC
jgi:transposase